MRFCVRSLRHLAIGVGLGVAALTLGPGFAAADTTQVAEATAIVDACSSAETSLRSARDLATNPAAAYRQALYTGEASVAQAYRLSLLTPWPADLTTLRTRLDNSLLVTIGKLAALDRPTRAWTTADIRGVLDKEITRMHRAVVLLQGVTPPAPAVAAPAPIVAPAAPPPPAPAPIATTAAPVLVPGTGFTGPTQQPAAIGTGKYSDAKTIARWDVVPYQTFTTNFPVGVIAFHAAEIDRVEFSLNGGSWVSVNTMSLNTVTNVWEYNAIIDPTSVADGQVEVRAVAYPKVGIPRVLAGPHDSSDAPYTHGEYSLLLSANAGGTQQSIVRYVNGSSGSDTAGDGSEAHPFKTIQQAAISVRDTPAPYTSNAGAGAYIYLDAYQDYDFADTGYGPTAWDRWITVAGKPGLSPDQVRITRCFTGGHGLNVKNVRLKNLTLYGDMQIISGSPEITPRIWADGCVLDGGSKDAYPVFFDPTGQWKGGIFVTDCTLKNMGRGAYGWQIARNLDIHDIGEDAIRNCGGTVVNCTVRDLVPIVNGVHPDLCQWNTAVGSQIENVIVYGLKTRNVVSQGIFIRQNGGSPAAENLAFVNCDMQVYGNAQILYDTNHLLFWNCNFLPVNGTGGSLLLADDVDHTTRIRNLSLRNSVVTYLSVHCTTEPLASDSSWADNNHYLPGSPDAPGTNATTSGTTATLFLSYPSDDTPATSSPLLNRVQHLLVPADANGTTRTAPDAVGAYSAAH